ncbi:hypothetical protein AB0C70_34700 [Streptomyces sp. NPDC048564]|uniref:hypothetical protein n=1 Tax=Streptomyces sp. NPDC048564 TaxID=3155760 RepID=UPI003413CEEE
MAGKPWFEFTLAERDDANRLGFLFETLQNDLQLGLVVDHFVMVLTDALDSEFAVRADGTYPPAGHDYPRLEP